MSDPDVKLVTIARFRSYPALMVARGQLEAAGIECYARNEWSLPFTVPFSNEWCTYADLQVRESDAEDAMAMLNSESPLAETDVE